jgi:hypothetical protein
MDIVANAAVVKADIADTLVEGVKTTQQSWRNYVAVDSLAANMPPIAREDFDEMVADVAEHGIRNEVTLFKDDSGNEFVLDGCNRLDAAERAGLPVIKDGALNPDVIPLRYVYGNIDRKKYVRAQNFLRRHLNAEQKRSAIATLLIEKPERSDRDIGREIGADCKTVAAKRRRMESRAEIPHVNTRTDSEGRSQPAEKKRRPVGSGQHDNAEHTSEIEHHVGGADEHQRDDDGVHSAQRDHGTDVAAEAPAPTQPAPDPATIAAAAVNQLSSAELQSFLDRLSPAHKRAFEQKFGARNSHNTSAEIATLAGECSALLTHAEQNTDEIRKKLARIRKLTGFGGKARDKTVTSNAQLDRGAFARGMGLAGQPGKTFPTMTMTPDGVDEFRQPSSGLAPAGRSRARGQR